MRVFVAICLLLLVAAPVMALTSIVVSDEGVGLMFGTFFNGSPAGQNLVLHLYCSNYTPVHGMTVSAWTECSGGGYAAKTLTNGSWTIQANQPPDALYNTTETFTFTGPLTTNTTIYGYVVTNAAGTTTLWAQMLDSAFTPANNGDSLTIPTMLQGSYGTPQ
jgi:hypothetical protein